ncbi:hypothetical protein GCM10010913_10340 [Paenibacillus aceti]|uniref:Uncharacterized protein n=1 Tax=Paenibacillus aceti TaxID=1820010 RepID=A0ABQ1VQT0_9BACL|nr:hypothetical protein GCM10010913_10340 [Paenibacillus aceti]
MCSRKGSSIALVLKMDLPEHTVESRRNKTDKIGQIDGRFSRSYNRNIEN